MTKICPECGNQIPDGADFCYHCGRSNKDAIVIDDKGNVVQGSNICKSCGCQISPGDLFCQHCGTAISTEQIAVTFKPKLTKKAAVAILLALIPGFFNVFGLGHLVFKRYSRAAMYLVLSVLILYSKYFLTMDGYMESLQFLFSIMIYFIQAMEVFTLAFIPPRPKQE